jgi:RNA-directed DNA polymerase
VHHFIVLYINPQVEQVLIEDCYSCRKNKGTLYGIERAKKKMRSVTQNYAKEAYILKLDISGYFMNMNTTILHNQKQKTICYNQNSKPFKVNTKHCNRPPPMLYC